MLFDLVLTVDCFFPMQLKILDDFAYSIIRRRKAELEVRKHMEVTRIVYRELKVLS